MMEHEIDLLHELMLVLETRQTSPRSTVVISEQAEAAVMGRSPQDVEAGLNRLLALAYIDGPGPDEPGFWLFRKLTRKGNAFLRATRSPADWERMKRRHAVRPGT